MVVKYIKYFTYDYFTILCSKTLTFKNAFTLHCKIDNIFLCLEKKHSQAL